MLARKVAPPAAPHLYSHLTIKTAMFISVRSMVRLACDVTCAKHHERLNVCPLLSAESYCLQASKLACLHPHSNFTACEGKKWYVHPPPILQNILCEGWCHHQEAWFWLNWEGPHGWLSLNSNAFVLKRNPCKSMRPQTIATFWPLWLLIISEQLQESQPDSKESAFLKEASELNQNLGNWCCLRQFKWFPGSGLKHLACLICSRQLAWFPHPYVASRPTRWAHWSQQLLDQHDCFVFALHGWLLTFFASAVSKINRCHN